MAAPQTERELLDAMARQEAAAKRIAALQSEIAKGGFVPADQKKHNALIAERVRLLAQQKQIEADIKRASPLAQAAVRMRQASADRFRELQEQRAAMREQLAVARQVREMDLRARFGQRAGGLLAGAERFAQSGMGRAIGGAATAFGAFAGNAARSGFSGTVEGNRLAFEFQLLNREFASAFKPVIELFTEGVSRVRRFMQSLDGAGQRMVMIAGLLAGAYGTMRVARSVGGALGLAGAASGAGSLLGMGGAGAAGAGAAALAGGGPKGATPPVVAGGGMSRVGGALAAASRATMFGAAVLDAPKAYDAFDAARRAREAKTSEERVGIAGDYLRGLRDNGGLTAGFGLDKLFLDSGYAKRKAAEGGIDLDAPATKANDPRRNVTPAEYGFSEVGSAYKRASVSFLNNEAASASDGKQMAEVATMIRDALTKNAEILEQIRRQGEPKGEVR